MFARAGAAGAELRADRGLEEPRGDRGRDGEGGGLHAGARRKLPGRQPLAGRRGLGLASLAAARN